MDSDIFGPVIYAYTREQAIADGALIDVSKTAEEAGFTVPVALTAALYEDCVAWDEADNDRKGTLQDEAGRLWDVVWMAANAVKRARYSDRATVTLHRVPRTGTGIHPRRVTFVAAVGGGDMGEPVITLMFSNED